MIESGNPNDIAEKSPRHPEKAPNSVLGSCCTLAGNTVERYPPGLPVGRIDSVTLAPRGTSYTITVQPLVHILLERALRDYPSHFTNPRITAGSKADLKFRLQAEAANREAHAR